MLSSGDIVDLDLGLLEHREAGFRRPAVVITAQRILDATPSVIQVVPLTSTIRGFGSEVPIPADLATGLDVTSAAQCQHIRAVSTARVGPVRGNAGAVAVRQIRETIAVILDLPG